MPGFPCSPDHPLERGNIRGLPPRGTPRHLSVPRWRAAGTGPASAWHAALPRHCTAAIPWGCRKLTAVPWLAMHSAREPEVLMASQTGHRSGCAQTPVSTGNPETPQGTATAYVGVRPRPSAWITSWPILSAGHSSRAELSRLTHEPRDPRGRSAECTPLQSPEQAGRGWGVGVDCDCDIIHRYSQSKLRD